MAITPEPFRSDVVRTFADTLISNFSQPQEQMAKTSCFDDFQLSTDEKLALQREVIEQRGKLLQGSFRSLTSYKETRWSNAFWFTHVQHQGLAMGIMDQRNALRLQESMTAIREVVKKENFFFVKVPPCFTLELPGYKSHDEFNSSLQVLYVEKRLRTPLLSKCEQHEVVRRLYMHYSQKKANEPFVKNLKQAIAEAITLLCKIPFFIRQKGPLFAEGTPFFHLHHFNDLSGSTEAIRARRFMRFFPDSFLLQRNFSLYSQPHLAHDKEKSRKYQLILQTFDARKYQSAKAPLTLPQDASSIEYSENESILRDYLLELMQKKIAENDQSHHLLASRVYDGFHTSTFWCAVNNEMMRDREPFSKTLEDLTKAIDELMKTDHLRKKKNEEAEGIKQTIDTVQKFIQKVKGQKPELPKIYYPLMIATLTKMKAEGLVIEWFDTSHKSKPADSDCHIKYRIYC